LLAREIRRSRVFQQSGPHEWGSSPGSSTPVSPFLALIGFVGLCLLVGAVAGTVTAGAVRGWYLSLNQPPGTPPTGVFAPVWTALYVMIGVSGWLVWKRCGSAGPLRLWGWQLAANALWTPAFFGLHSPPLGMLVIVVLLVLIVSTIRAFLTVHRFAAFLMLPYFGWALFASYLNAGFWWLNAAG
jgi:translocator protein